jgi:hypothetical protein
MGETGRSRILYADDDDDDDAVIKFLTMTTTSWRGQKRA